MDIHNCAKAEGQHELAGDAFNKAREIYTEIQEDVNSDCSRSSCSECEPQSSPEPPESAAAEEYVNVKRISTRPVPHQSSQSHTDCPPLPVFNYARPKKSWAQEINNAPYVPPLPFASNRNSEPIRVNLPKLELKVSAYSKKNPDRSAHSGRHRGHSSANYSAAALTSDNILLVDPPLPTIIRKTSSQDNLISIDVVPQSTHRLYHNSFSTESLNNLVSSAGYPNLNKIPRALPRIHMNPSTMPIQQKHTVIEVVPKPSTHIKPIVPATWKVPDQTLGIPLTTPIPSYHQPQYVHRPPAFAIPTDATSAAMSSHFAIKSQSLLNIPIIHQHPITQANIPASSSASTAQYFQRSPQKESHGLTKRTHQPPSTSVMSSILIQAQPSPRREPNAEKNKVKFSDTVTVALVPEITRKDKPIPLGGAAKRPPNGFALTDPQRELADSLPLCHPNDDYLKDFTPISSTDEVRQNVSESGFAVGHDRNGNNQLSTAHSEKLSANVGGGGAIKVVHFGVI